MFVDPDKIANNFGLVPKAISFLAGYGTYICVSTDRFVGRMLDIHAKQRKVSGHPLIGLFNVNVYKRVKIVAASASMPTPFVSPSRTKIKL